MTLSKVSISKESFMDKIESLSQSTQNSSKFTLNNFENFYMEKYGKADIIQDMKKANDEDVSEDEFER